MATITYRDGKTIPYELNRHPRSRRVTLRVFPDGRVRVTAPPRASSGAVERGVRMHAEWLRRTWERVVRERQAAPAVHRLGPADYARHKARARLLVHQRLAHFNAVYGFRWTAVSVRDQSSRWGSCSRRGALSFNYRLALLPPHLADYVVVHELCHLAQFDHSKKFWALVARAVPDHKACRRELRQSGLLGG